MASYLYEMVSEPTKLRNVPDSWDMSDYEGIEDFQCLTDFSFARRGQCAF